MTDGPCRTRRAVLRLSALAAAGVAGCATFESGSETETSGPDSEAANGDAAGDPADEGAGEPTATRRVGSAATDSTGQTGTPELDLREANVTAVAVEQAGDGTYRFSVTLYHDDDGARLGRRELLHPHSTAPFTRSETVEIPSGTTCVVVRGHDQTHGYGGQAMLVTAESGATRAVGQGSEKASLAGEECP